LLGGQRYTIKVAFCGLDFCIPSPDINGEAGGAGGEVRSRAALMEI